MPIQWEDYQAEFASEGTLRELRVLSTSLAHWQTILEFLRLGAIEHSYYIEGEELALPSCASESFLEKVDPMMVLKVGSVPLECFFFSEEEIEFSFLPRHVQSEIQAEAIFTFMGDLAHLLNKEVIMVEEDDADRPIFRFTPNDGHIHYMSSGTLDF